MADQPIPRHHARRSRSRRARRVLGTPRACAARGAVLGTADRARQLTLVEGTYRHLAELHLGCESEADLVAIADPARGARRRRRRSPTPP